MPAINKASNPRSAIRRSGRCARQRRLLARHDSRVQSWLNLYPGSEKAMLSINGRGEIKVLPTFTAHQAPFVQPPTPPDSPLHPFFRSIKPEEWSSHEQDQPVQYSLTPCSSPSSDWKGLGSLEGLPPALEVAPSGSWQALEEAAIIAKWAKRSQKSRFFPTLNDELHKIFTPVISQPLPPSIKFQTRSPTSMDEEFMPDDCFVCVRSPSFSLSDDNSMSNLRPHEESFAIVFPSECDSEDDWLNNLRQSFEPTEVLGADQEEHHKFDCSDTRIISESEGEWVAMTE